MPKARVGWEYEPLVDRADVARRLSGNARFVVECFRNRSVLKMVRKMMASERHGRLCPDIQSAQQ